MMKHLLLAATLLSPLPAFAFGEAERAKVEEAAARFAALFDAGQYDKVIDFTPPRLMTQLAETADRPIEELRPLVINQTLGALSQVTIHSLKLNTRRLKTGTTSAGIDYAFIPTKTTVSPRGKSLKTTKRAHTLALIEEGRVYLINIEGEAQMQTLRAAYPSFNEVKAPR